MYCYLFEGALINRIIDETDAKIIKDLLADARKSFVEIASECNVSTATISDRFFELEKAGIIIGSTIHVNQKALGRTICSTAISVDQREAEQVIDFIKKLPYDSSLIALLPKNSISLVAGLKDIREVGKFKESIKRNKYVTDVKIEVWTDVKNMPERLQIIENTPKEKNIELLPEEHKTNYKLDEIDHQIINKLLHNSRQPFGKMAIDIGTSINTISRKYKRLIENGIIRSTIQLSLPKLGYYAVVVFPISFGSEVDPNEVIKELFTIKDSFLMIKTSGEVDLFAFVMLKDLNQLLETQKQISKTHGISKTDMKLYSCLVPWPATGEFISTF